MDSGLIFFTAERAHMNGISSYNGFVLCMIDRQQ